MRPVSRIRLVCLQPGLLKTFPPRSIRSFVDEAHAERVGEILE